MSLKVYIPNTPQTAKEWLEDEVTYYKMNDFKYVVINENFGTVSLDELCIDINKLNDVRFIIFCYPENGKFAEQIYKFLEYAVNLAREKHVYILTVSDWLIHFLNLFVFLGEFTISERKEIMEHHGLNAWIRFADVKVMKISYNDEIKMIEHESLPLLHHAPPEYDFNINDEMMEWTSSKFIALDLAYDKNRRE
jgi:hypothetical protein